MIDPKRGHCLSLRRFALLSLLGLPVLLSACGGDSWFGGGKSGPPLPGERVTILTEERGLTEATRSTAPVVLPKPEPNEDWPQNGGYAHHAMHHMMAGDSLQPLWKAGIGEGSTKRGRVINTPVVAEGKLFTIDRKATVRAFDAQTGKRLWETDLPERGTEERDGEFIGGGVAYDEGRIIATTGFARVVALDAASGTELWRASVDAPIRAAPAVNSGRVIVVTMGNQTVALSAKDGEKLWSHSGVPESTSLLGAPTPAIDQGIAVVAYSSGELYALRLETGSELWADSVTAIRRTDAAGMLYDIRANPVIDRNRLFVIGNSGLMVGMDLRSGSRLWQLRVAGTQTPWVAGEVIYLVSEDAELAAVSARTGEVMWVVPLPRWKNEEKQTGALFWTGPMLVSDRLIVGASDDSVYSFSPYSGELLGRIELPDPMAVPPIAANGVIYFLTERGQVVAYR